jgi:hypothetical protein
MLSRRVGPGSARSIGSAMRVHRVSKNAAECVDAPRRHGQASSELEPSRRCPLASPTPSRACLSHAADPARSHLAFLTVQGLADVGRMPRRHSRESRSRDVCCRTQPRFSPSSSLYNATVTDGTAVQLEALRHDARSRVSDAPGKRVVQFRIIESHKYRAAHHRSRHTTATLNLRAHCNELDARAQR